MAERIQDILARHKAEQIKNGNRKAAEGLLGLQKRIAQADRRGWFAQNVNIPPRGEAPLPQRLKPDIYLPTSVYLIASETEGLERFFGTDIKVPTPSDELFDSLEKLAREGIGGFKARFLPGITLKEGDSLPGWNVKPKKWFWEKAEDGIIEQGATTLNKGWYLVDERGKPDYASGRQRYGGDVWFQAIIDGLKAEGKIQTHSSVVSDSRFGVSPNEIENVILPEFARVIGTRGIVRNRRYIEFNVWGNMVHPEWGKTTTREWFADKFRKDLRLLGGDSGDGGLAHVSCDWSDYCYDDAGFSPVIAFPFLS